MDKGDDALVKLYDLSKAFDAYKQQFTRTVLESSLLG